MVYLNLVTGEVRPARCGRLVCSYCVLRESWRRAAAIAHAAPERALTLTLVASATDSEPWATARYRLNRTREWLKRAKVEPGEWVSHVEGNPRGTGYHAHIWQHGSHIPKVALQRAAHHAGCGWSRIERVREVGSAAAYGLKGLAAAGYGLKGVEDSAERYLEVNGRRLTHQSRGFFRDGAGGHTVPVRQAERLALRRLFGDNGSVGPWTVATEAGARSYLSLRPKSGPASATPAPGTPTAG